MRGRLVSQFFAGICCWSIKELRKEAGQSHEEGKNLARAKGTFNVAQTYHRPGTVRGLYLRYFFLHSILSQHFSQTPSLGKDAICLVFLELGLWRKALLLLCV